MRPRLRALRRLLALSAAILAAAAEEEARGDGRVRPMGGAPRCAPQAPRSDCGYFGIGQAECESRGCCWNPVTDTEASSSSSGNDTPWCYFANGPQQQAVYGVEEVQALDPGGAAVRLRLRLRPGTASQPELGPDVEALQVDVEAQAEGRLYVRVQPAAPGSPGPPPWRVPDSLLPRPPPPGAPPASPRYELQLPRRGDDFTLRVVRPAAAAAAAGTGRTAAAAGDDADADGADTGTAAEDVLLDLRGGGCLVVKPQYVQLRSGVAPDVDLYGLGESTQAEGLRLRRDGTARALWNSDTPAAAVGVNLYGSWPVLYGIGPGGAAFGWFVAASNAMDAVPGSGDVEFRITGGMLELFVFAGPSPDEVTAQYTEVVGRPAMPPRWALGFHQSRYGYRSVDELSAVAAAYGEARIPLEVVWSDIDYTDRFRMFTFDQQRYPPDRLRAFVDGLHARGQRWVPIIDCGITALPGAGYLPYERGLAAGVFVRDSTGGPLVGQVWSGATHWPDFVSHPNATPYWTALLAELHAVVPFDGIWLDMNEPSNFCTGECAMPPSPVYVDEHREEAGEEDEEAQGVTQQQQQEQEEAEGAQVSGGAAGGEGLEGPGSGTGGGGGAAAAAAMRRRLVRRLGIACQLQCTAPGPNDPLAHPPYAVNNGNRRAPLYTNTVPMGATGYGGARQYDTHNLYALAESAATHAALRAVAPAERPFILTRSSWAGQGRYAAHWSGDNAATWDDLRRSVASLLHAGGAGMALAGADICGFMGATSEQLCARWLSAGAFYTFVRDHSDVASPPQEAYRWPAAAQAARSALAARYSLLPYLYTAFHAVHTEGGAVARPLAWAAPWDPRARDIASQWLLGGDLMVAPVLQPDTEWVTAFFPGPPATAGAAGAGGGGGGGYGGVAGDGTWCRYDNLSDCHTGPAEHLLPSPLGAAPPLFLRAGAVVPTQPPPPGAPPHMTTAAAAAAPLVLIILLATAPATTTTATTTATAMGGAMHGGGGNSALAAGDACGGGGSGGSWGQVRPDLVAEGRLYADNGTSPYVNGPDALTAVVAAGASLAAGCGWVSYVTATPAARESGGGGGGADTDASQLRVGGLVVVGAPVLPGCGVSVSVGGADVPPERVALDAGAHVLRVIGLDLPAAQAWRLTWASQPPAPPGPGGPEQQQEQQRRRQQ